MNDSVESRNSIRNWITRADGAAVQLEHFLEKLPWLFPVCLCLGISLFGYLLANTRRLWFDEIGTVLMLRDLSRRSIWESLQSGVDMAPPLYFLFCKAVADLTGAGPLVARYVAVGGMCAAVLAVYTLARRWMGALYACLASILLLHTAALLYVTEGRPYSLVIATSALAAIGWERSASGGRRYLAIAGMALAAGVGMALHYYTVFVLFPLGIAQLARDFQRRRLDIPVWIGLLAPLAVLAAHLPLLRAGQGVYGKHAWQNVSPPSIPELYRFLTHEAGTLVFLFLFLHWLTVRWPEKTPETPAGPRIPAPVWFLLAAVLFVPVVSHTAGRLIGMMPTFRYLIYTSLGVALTPVLLLAVWRPVRPLVRVAILCLAVLSLGREFRNEYKSHTATMVSFPWLRENVSAGGDPVLTTDSHLFQQLVYYREAEKLPWIQFPDSIENNIRYLGEDSALRNLMAYRAAFPEMGLYRWERPATGPWRYQALRRKGRNAWEINEAMRLGGTVRLLRAGEGWELFAVEIPAP